MAWVEVGSTEPGNTSSHRPFDSTEASATQIYFPLNHEKREIRLLTLPSAKDKDEAIQLRLRHATLYEKPAFEALSYCWGNVDDKTNITLNGTTVWITRNLETALKYWRNPQKDLQIWVDALCIDQGDEAEKQNQIPFMKYIYQHASNVMIWLGLADDSTSAALKLIRLAAECLRKETGRNMPEYHDDALREEFNDERNKARGFPSIAESDSWLPLSNFFARKWFSRCWIMQESALATSATVQLGDLCIDWSLLCAAAIFFSRKSYASTEKTIFKEFDKVNRLCINSQIGLELKDWDPQPLMHLLAAAVNAEAKLPRDRIYALLGLTDEKTRNHFFFPPDMESRQFFPEYASTTMTELCTYTSHFLMNDNWPGYGYPLRALAWKKHYPIDKSEQHEGNKTDGESMPSWVQRWHGEISAQQRPYVLSDLPCANKFCAGGEYYPGSVFDPKEPYKLKLNGFIFGIVTHANHFMRLIPLPRYRLWDFVVEIRSVLEGISSYPTGQSMDEVLAQTLTVADQRNDGRIGATYQGIDFQHFCVSVFEQTVEALQSERRFEDLQRLRTDWGMEYQRLRGLVGAHEKSPTFSQDLQWGCGKKKLFVTSRGYLGVGDITMQPKDLICVFLGGKTPFIIRPAEGGYHFVGECYLHGIMEGEALEKGRQNPALITLI